MIFLKTLRIVRFGTLRDKEITLTNGMNLLVGDNESGKSTLADFIRFIFYGFDDRQEKEQRMPPDGAPAEGFIVFLSDDRLLRCERFASVSAEKAQVTDEATGAVIMSGAGIGEKYFGLPREVYATTAYFRQAGGGLVNGRDIGEAIDNLLFGADESVDTAKALKRLDEARIALWHKNKKGGRIFELEKQREALLARRDAAVLSSREVITTSGQLAETKDKLDASLKRSTFLSGQLDAYRQEQRRKRQENVRVLADRLKTAELLVSDAEKFLSPNVAALLRLHEETESLRSKVRTLEESLTDLTDGNESTNVRFAKRLAEEGGSEEVRTALEGYGTDIRRFVRFSALSGGLTVLFAVLCAVFAVQRMLLLAGIFGGAALLSLILFAVLLIRTAGKRRERDSLLDLFDADSPESLSRQLALSETDTSYERICRLQEELAARRADCAGKAAAEEQAAAKLGFSSIKEALTELAIREKELLSLRNEADKQRALFENAKSVESGIPAPEAASDVRLPADFDPAAAEREFKFLSKAADSLRERAHRCEVRLAELSAASESPADLTEQLRALDARISLCKRRYEAYILAYQTLSVAGDEFRSSIAPRLSADAGSFMKLLTGGKYENVGVDSSFSLHYTDPSGARTAPVSHMSQGTRDAAYLSLRLALLGLLCKASLPPLIFDESFVYYDDTRLENTLAALSSLSSVQIILLSAASREKAILKNAQSL